MCQALHDLHARHVHCPWLRGRHGSVRPIAAAAVCWVWHGNPWWLLCHANTRCWDDQGPGERASVNSSLWPRLGPLLDLAAIYIHSGRASRELHSLPNTVRRNVDVTLAAYVSGPYLHAEDAAVRLAWLVLPGPLGLRVAFEIFKTMPGRHSKHAVRGRLKSGGFKTPDWQHLNYPRLLGTIMSESMYRHGFYP